MITKAALLIFFITPAVYAYEGFRCFPSFRQTRLQILVKDKTVELLVVNPGGYEFMPQFDGSGSQYLLAFNKMQAEDLKELADGFIFTWPKEKCKLDTDNFEINCSGEAIKPVKSIKSFGISTTEVVEKYNGEIYEKRKFRLNVEKDNIYFVNLEFYKTSCEKL